MSGRRRAQAIACLALAGAVAPASASCQADARLGRSSVLGAAEAALARGDAACATVLFEGAASHEHAADIELGLVRSAMQAGGYRRALAAGAHVAGAHGEEPEGAALYAWLLALGAQGGMAQRVLGEAQRRHPGSALLAAVDAQWRREGAPPEGELLRAPLRLAPYASGDEPTASARVAASGWLFDGGDRALVPARAIAHARRVWVRDGLGRTREAAPAALPAGTGLAELRLLHPLDGATPAELSARDAFPGAPVFAVEYAGSAATAAWPWMHVVFLGMPEAEGQVGPSVELPAGARGGPVFDIAGRLVGLALPDEAGAHARLLPVSMLIATFGARRTAGCRVSDSHAGQCALRARPWCRVAGDRGRTLTDGPHGADPAASKWPVPGQVP